MSKSILCLIAVFVLSAGQALADAMVWKVSKGEHTMYVGGTIHVLSADDYPLPEAFDEAYRQSVKVVLEVDLQPIQQPSFQSKLLAMMRYENGKTLRDVLSEKTMQRLEAHMQSRGVPIDQLLPYKVGMAAMTLTMIELQRLGLAGAGVDEFYYRQALRDRKGLGALETLESQLAFLAKMGEGMEDALIRTTIDDMNALPSMMKTMKQAWVKGNRQQLQTLLLEPLQTDFPKVYQNLIVQRNEAWMAKLEQLAQTAEIELILVGALHLVGQDSILAKLQAQGYQLERLSNLQ